jgi:hypothetical protein
MDELRDLLYSLAERFTKSPIGPGTGNTRVSSTSKGFQVTAIIDIKKFSKVYSEREISAVLTELEKDFFPDLGVSCTLVSIRLSRFITEGGPWVDDRFPGAKIIYEIGKPIIGQIDQDVLKNSHKTK